MLPENISRVNRALSPEGLTGVITTKIKAVLRTSKELAVHDRLAGSMSTVSVTSSGKTSSRVIFASA